MLECLLIQHNILCFSDQFLYYDQLSLHRMHYYNSLQVTDEAGEKLIFLSIKRKGKNTINNLEQLQFKLLKVEYTCVETCFTAGTF